MTERVDYLNSLADDYGVEKSVVYDLAELLGPEEDYDGLISALEDCVDMDYYMDIDSDMEDIL